MRLPIRLRLFSTRGEWSFLRRSAIATAIACPHKMPWTIFPRIDVGAVPGIAGAAFFL